MAIRDLMPFGRSRERDQRPVLHRPSSLDAWWQDMDSLFQQFFGDSPLAVRANGEDGLTPRINLTENDREIRIEAEMPGMNEEDIELVCERNQLVLRGEKRHEHREQDGDMRRVECSYGRFERTLPLPDYAKADQAKAAYRNGVLTVTVPKDKSKAPAKRIPVKAG